MKNAKDVTLTINGIECEPVDADKIEVTRPSRKTINVSELSGAALDWAVARAVGFDGRAATSSSGVSRCYIPGPNVHGGTVYLRGEVKKNIFGKVKPESLEPIGYVFEPSTDWIQGGPLIEDHGIKAGPLYWPFDMAGPQWFAVGSNDYKVVSERGPTPLIAACRAIVAAKLGDTVEVPEELL